jgi:hypothetical protein
MYDSTDKAVYQTFRSKLQAKLMLDQAAIGSYHGCMWYAFSRLKGNAAAALAPWMDQYGNNLTATQATLNSMYDQLDLMFLDRGRSEKALRELRNLHQGSRPFNELLADLNRLLMEAGGHSWSDEVKKNYLDGALSYEVEGALIGVTKEETFADYCRQVQQVAN